MEFFGLTSYGASNPIKILLRDDYKEPQDASETDLIKFKDTRTESEKIKELDCYIGPADGFAYNSNDRLIRMRQKYLFKPIGPSDIYKYPATTSMVYGWWQFDPILLKQIENNNDWFTPTRHAVITSEMSRFVDYCRKTNPLFKL